MSITIEGEENEESQSITLHIQSAADNWRSVYKSLLIPKELECLKPACLVNDLIIEAFLR